MNTTTPSLIQRVVGMPDARQTQTPDIAARGEPSLTQSIFTEVKPASRVSELLTEIEEEAVSNAELIARLQATLAPVLLPPAAGYLWQGSEVQANTVQRLEELKSYLAHQSRIISQLIIRIDL